QRHGQLPGVEVALGKRLVVRKPGLLERVGEGVVADVMQQRGELDVSGVGGVHAVAGLLELGEGPTGEVRGAEHVLEAGGGGAVGTRSSRPDRAARTIARVCERLMRWPVPAGPSVQPVFTSQHWTPCRAIRAPSISA